MAEDTSPGVGTDSIIKVSGSSNPQSVGSILARAISAGYTPKMRAIGASAVNQSVKACANMAARQNEFSGLWKLG